MDGKRMKECIFLLVLGWLKTSVVFSCTWSSTCSTYRNSQCSCFLTVPKNVTFQGDSVSVPTSKDTTEEWRQAVTESLLYPQISRTPVTQGYVTLISKSPGCKRTYHDHLHLTSDGGQHTKVAFKYFHVTA